jgi:hypothetical protein
MPLVYISREYHIKRLPYKKSAAGHTSSSGGGDYFVAKVDTSLSTAMFSSHLGQNSMPQNSMNESNTLSHGMAVRQRRERYVVGGASAGFPTTSGAF